MTDYMKQTQNSQNNTATKGRTSKAQATNKWAQDNNNMDILKENSNIEMTDATNSLIKTMNNTIQPKTSPEHMEHKKASNMTQKTIQWAMESDDKLDDDEEEHMIEEKHIETKSNKKTPKTQQNNNQHIRNGSEWLVHTNKRAQGYSKYTHHRVKKVADQEHSKFSLKRFGEKIIPPSMLNHDKTKANGRSTLR
eukprot:3341017-Ditylum_brightwellii.AAC.1